MFFLHYFFKKKARLKNKTKSCTSRIAAPKEGSYSGSDYIISNFITVINFKQHSKTLHLSTKIER